MKMTKNKTLIAISTFIGFELLCAFAVWMGGYNFGDRTFFVGLYVFVSVSFGIIFMSSVLDLTR